MNGKDLIHNAGYVPLYDEITACLNEPARLLWQDVNEFIQDNFKVSPKVTYSKCAAQPGWNVKYQKSGKSICTLYPERESFITLVVISLDLVPIVRAMSDEFEPIILQMVDSAKPFNGTLWLMIPVTNKKLSENVKHLIILKHEAQRSKKK